MSVHLGRHSHPRFAAEVKSASPDRGPPDLDHMNGTQALNRQKCADMPEKLMPALLCLRKAQKLGGKRRIQGPISLRDTSKEYLKSTHQIALKSAKKSLFSAKMPYLPPNQTMLQK